MDIHAVAGYFGVWTVTRRSCANVRAIVLATGSAVCASVCQCLCIRAQTKPFPNNTDTAFARGSIRPHRTSDSVARYRASKICAVSTESCGRISMLSNIILVGL